MIRRGEIRAAGPLLERAYELDPDNNHGLAGLARVYIQRGDGTRAVQMAQAAVGHSRRARGRWLGLLHGDVGKSAEGPGGGLPGRIWWSPTLL